MFCFLFLIGYGLVYNEMVKRFDGECIVYVVDFLEELVYEKEIVVWYVESMINI